jgi:hypothetical protein
VLWIDLQELLDRLHGFFIQAFIQLSLRSKIECLGVLWVHGVREYLIRDANHRGPLLHLVFANHKVTKCQYLDGLQFGIVLDELLSGVILLRIVVR